MDDSTRRKRTNATKKAAIPLVRSLLPQITSVVCFFENVEGNGYSVVESSGYATFFNILLLQKWPCTDPEDEANGSPKAIQKARTKFFDLVKNHDAGLEQNKKNDCIVNLE